MYTHPAETSSRPPQTPIGSGVAIADEANAHTHSAHHPIADKADSTAAISDASARGQTTTNGGSLTGSTANASLTSGQAPLNGFRSVQLVGTIAAPSTTTTTGSAQQFTQEAQQIVEEERAAAEKLPVYPGLQDRFTLLEKMGE